MCVRVCMSSFVLPSSSRWFRNSVLDFRSQERTTVLLSLRSVATNQRSLMTGQYSLRCLENSKCKFVHEYSGELIVGKTLLNHFITNSKIWNCLCLTMTVLCYIVLHMVLCTGSIVYFIIVFMMHDQCVALWCGCYSYQMEAMKDMSKGIPEKWRLFFKLFCYISPQNVPTDSIESAFMFEQVYHIIM